MPEPSARRAPVQARSAETVQAILGGASALLGRIPFDQITTSRIAEEAGLSVGALYRFYSDKQEIFDTIAVDELRLFRTRIEAEFSTRRLLLAPRKSLYKILDAYVAFLDERPHFRELALGRHISDATREIQSDPATGPGGLLQDLLVSKFGIKPGKSLELRLRVAAEVGDRLIAFAYAQKSDEARAAVIDELKILLAKYLIR
jgi:AcrR family transcriptional regulator